MKMRKQKNYKRNYKMKTKMIRMIRISPKIIEV